MSDRTIRDAINQITGTHFANKVYVLDAVVVSVDEGARTCVCQVVSGKASNTINDVRLMAAADDGVLIIPEVDSNVCIIVSDYTEPYISQYSAVKNIIWRGGDLGGLIKIEQLTNKLNNLVNMINTELPKIAAGIATGGGSYVPVTMDQFLKSDYENIAVTHG